MTRDPPAVEESFRLSIYRSESTFTPWGVGGHLSKRGLKELITVFRLEAGDFGASSRKLGLSWVRRHTK